jgi:NitT/TauT family transport system permease protein
MKNFSVKEYARRWITIRDKPGPIESAVSSLLCIGIVLLIWHFLTAGPLLERIVGPSTLPPLGETFQKFRSLWFERELSRSAVWSLGRVVGGFFLAAIIGVPLGLAAGSFLRLNAFFKPLSVFGRNIPIAALIPLTLNWFASERPRRSCLFFWPVSRLSSSTVSTVQNVPNNYLDAAYTSGRGLLPRPGILRALLVAVRICRDFHDRLLFSLGPAG